MKSRITVLNRPLKISPHFFHNCHLSYGTAIIPMGSPLLGFEDTVFQAKNIVASLRSSHEVNAAVSSCSILCKFCQCRIHSGYVLLHKICILCIETHYLLNLMFYLVWIACNSSISRQIQTHPQTFDTPGKKD